MNIDFILSDCTVRNMFDCLGDTYFHDRALLYMQFLGVGDAAWLPLDEKGQPQDPEAIGRLQSRAAAALGDRSPERARAIARLMSDHMLWEHDRHALLDVVSAAWLDQLGLSAAELYMLSSFGEETRIERRDGTRVNNKDYILITSKDGDAGFAPTLEVVYEFKKMCWWAGTQLDLDEEMAKPETVRAACIGRPLREVFSHPHLDAHDIAITSWDDPTVIMTDVGSVAVFPS